MWLFRILSINSRKYSSLLSSLQFPMKPSLRCYFNPLKTIYRQLSDIAHPYNLFTSQYFEYDDSLLLSQSFIYLFLAFKYWWIALITYQGQLRDLILTVVLKAACHTNPGTENYLTGCSSYILRHIFRKLFHKSVNKIVYHLEHSFINCQHPNIKFTLEKEHNKTLPFLDILVNSNENKIETSVYYRLQI